MKRLILLSILVFSISSCNNKIESLEQQLKEKEYEIEELEQEISNKNNEIDDLEDENSNLRSRLLWCN